MIRLLLAAAAGVGAAIAVASSVTGVSDDTNARQVHCVYCGAVDDGRSTLRFWFIDGDLFCETCAAGEADAIIGGLRARHPEWAWPS